MFKLVHSIHRFLSDWLSPQLPKPIGEETTIKYDNLCKELKKYGIKVNKNRRFILPKDLECRQTGSNIVFFIYQTDSNQRKHLLNINATELTIVTHFIRL